MGYSERYHTVVSTYQIILCFSYLLTQNRDYNLKGCDRRFVSLATIVSKIFEKFLYDRISYALTTSGCIKGI